MPSLTLLSVKVLRAAQNIIPNKIQLLIVMKPVWIKLCDLENEQNYRKKKKFLGEYRVGVKILAAKETFRRKKRVIVLRINLMSVISGGFKQKFP